jgi:hypothetical protein
MGIYVETPIHCTIDELWEKTQNPRLHQRWDLRFTTIEYLSRETGQPQRFLYSTRIGLGVRIAGQGESVGTREGDQGARTSSLKFWSDDQKSLIKVGSGYWKYVPTQEAIRFFTWYDYQTRFGLVGKIIDKVLFRPLLGWATAWSFDRLRLWIERGIPPESSRDRWIIYALARGTMAFIWLYHGLVPKLLFHDRIELDLLNRIGTAPAEVNTAVTLAGFGEIAFALLLIILWRQHWLLWATVILMLAGIPVVALTAASYLAAAFNPLTLNVSLAALASIAIVAGRELPMATRCRRTPKDPL